MKTKQVALLCDVPGLWWAATKFAKGRVDYMKLRTALMLPDGQNGRQLMGSSAWLHDRDGINRFEGALRFMGYVTQTVPRGTPIDQLIMACAVEMSNWPRAAIRPDIVAIAASSGRYTMLKPILQQVGIELEIWAFPVPCQLDEMKQLCDRWCVLGDDVFETRAAS